MDNNNKPMPMYDLSPEVKKARDAKRQAQILRWRIWQGIKAPCTRPWKFAFIVLLDAAFLFCWCRRDILLALIPLDYATMSAIKVQAFTYAFYAFLIFVFLFLLALLLYVLGIPRKDRKIDKGLPVIFRHDADYGYWPIYLSCQRQGDLYKYEFLSEYLPLEMWERCREKVATLLGGYIDSIEYGGKDQNDLRRIVVYAGEGAKPQERQAPADPLFRR